MQPGPGSRPAVPNHMVWSIVCILLFWPLAIPAIVNASKVNALLAAGDHAGAQNASRSARKWATWATVIGAVALVLCCPLGFVVAAAPRQVASTVAHLLGYR